MREAPSLVLIQALLQAGATVTAFDPEANNEARRILGDKVRFADHALAACDGADALILVTEWSEFRHLDLDEIKARLRQRVLFDGRNIWDGERVRAQGFTYYGIGVK
jgi:UDPglucose 6-dehydrogenase